MAHTIHYPFNFFASLPDFAIQNTTKQMEIFDLIMLSSCSKRCATAVRLSRVPSVSAKILIYTNEIEIKSKKKSWRFSSIHEFENEGEIKRFNFKHLPVARNEKGFLETVIPENVDLAFNAVISQILFIIPSTTFSELKFIRDPENFHCRVALAGISQVEYLEIHLFITAEESKKFILETIQAKKIKDDTRSHISEDWDLRLIHATPELYFNDADFLKPFENFENFPSKNTETATLCDVTFNERDFINFLKWFKDVPADRISKFRGIKWRNKGYTFKMPDLSEFNAKKYNPQERGRYFPKSHYLCCARVCAGGMTPRRQCSHFIDTEKGWDIVRSDELLGTVLDENRTVLFLVWHERFPNTEDRRF